MIIILFVITTNLEGTWSTPVVISSSVSDQPDIAVDIAGNATTVWQGYDGSSYVIQSSTLPLGGSWSAVSTLLMHKTLKLAWMQ